MAFSAKGFSNMVNNMVSKTGLNKIASNLKVDGGFSTNIRRGSERIINNNLGKNVKHMNTAFNAGKISQQELDNGVKNLVGVANNMSARINSYGNGALDTFANASNTFGGKFRNDAQVLGAATADYFWTGANTGERITRIGTGALATGATVGAAGYIGNGVSQNRKRVNSANG